MKLKDVSIYFHSPFWHKACDVSMSMKQRTIKRKIEFRGVGLHSGEKVNMTIHPAPENHGIVFLKKTDAEAKPTAIKAHVSNVVRTDMCTVIGVGQEKVSTIEHLMAALYGAGIDDALIEINASEVPVLDGSARIFLEGIEDVGFINHKSSKKILKLLQPVSVELGDKKITATPSNSFSLSGEIEFSNQIIGKQHFNFEFSLENRLEKFKKEISSARTFGFLNEVEFLKSRGLALGGSLENAVVLDDHKILNPEGLRFQNEFIRHKILDALGDFALIGFPIQAKIEITKSGHELHAMFLKKILQDPANYEIIESKNQVNADQNNEWNETDVDELPLYAHSF